MFAREFRFAIRSLCREPGFFSVAVLTLALGIGANTVVFSLLNAAVVHPLPYPHPDRLMMLRDRQSSTSDTNVSFPEFVDWRARSAGIADIAAVFNTTQTVSIAEPRTVMAQRISANLFQTLGVSPLMGRPFRQAEEPRTAAQVVAIGEAFWEREFGSDPDVLGRELLLNDEPHTIVAVMPREFGGVLPRDRSTLQPKELWLPLRLDESTAPRGVHVLTVIARLHAGIAPDVARERFEALSVGLTREGHTTHGLAAYPLVGYVGQSVRPMLFALSGAVAVVLLMTCANLANLLLAHVTARRRDIAIRAAIGAGRRGILSRFAAEACVLTGFGAIAGLVLAVAALRVMSGIDVTTAINFSQVRVDLVVLAFTATASLFAGVLFVMAPAIQALRIGVLPLLQETGRSHTGATGIRGILVAVETGLAVLLLVAAGLLSQSFAHVLDAPRGFDPTHVLSFHVSASRADALANRHGQFFDTLLERLSTRSEISSVGLINELPLGGGWVSGETPIDGRISPDGQVPVADKRIVSPGYFTTMGIRLVRGRTFSEGDRAGATPVAIVSELYAQRYFPGEDPIGRRVSFAWEMEGFQQIVGIVSDVRHEGLDIAPEPTIYVSYLQRPSTAFSVVVKSMASARDVAGAIRNSVRATDASRPVDAIRTLDDALEGAVAPRRLVLQVIVAFALMAVILAAVGVYGVASASAQGRMREIGLRVALGAQPIDIITLVLRRNAVLTSVGLAAGLAGSIATRRVIEAYLLSIASTDVRTLLTSALLLGGISLIAAYLPIRRALRMGPMRALQNESN